MDKSIIVALVLTGMLSSCEERPAPNPPVQYQGPMIHEDNIGKVMDFMSDLEQSGQISGYDLEEIYLNEDLVINHKGFRYEVSFSLVTSNDQKAKWVSDTLERLFGQESGRNEPW